MENVVYGNLVVYGTQESISCTTGSIVANGGLSTSKNSFIGGTLTVNDSVFFNSSLTTFGNFTLSKDQDSSSPDNGSLVITGGAGIMKSLHIGGDLFVHNNVETKCVISDLSLISGDVDSTSKTTGTCIIKGGIGVSKSVYCESLHSKELTITGPGIILDNTRSINYATGGLVVTGGVGIGGNLNVKGDIMVAKIESLSMKTQILDFDQTILGEYSSGMFSVKSNVLAGIRLSLTDTNKFSRYYNSLEMFTLGNSWVDKNTEAIQISNDESGNFRIMTRSSGTGRCGNLLLQGGGDCKLELSKSGLDVTGGKITLNTKVSVACNSDSQVYTLVLPSTPPPKGKRAALVCDEFGQLSWEVL